MLWALIQRLGKEALNVLFLIWLASILMPEDFGAFYIGLVWLGLARLFIDLGFPLALIRMKHLNQAHLTSFFFLNIFTGFLVLFIFIIISYKTQLITDNDEYACIRCYSSYYNSRPISTVFRLYYNEIYSLNI